jgi:Na+/proline symporter
MNAFDYAVLIGSMLAIIAYGMWRSRGRRSLTTYVKGDGNAGWGTIGLSVAATQASAVTFLSIPGQGFESGLGFVQNYFGLPFALIIIAVVFVPIYRKLNVYTAYEYLGRRFDGKTRVLAASLFLLQRGLAAGITIYAPAIVLSTVFGWQLDLTIVVSGLVVTVYTVFGGSEAVNQTHKWQVAVIFGGMVAALIILLNRLPSDVSLGETLAVAGGLGKMEAVSFSLDPDVRYTFWTGTLGGIFLSLSYFGTDQSQVQRYLSGGSLRESRLGLMFNAVLKIPMQFFILLLGVLMFVFFQFERPPVFFNETVWRAQAAGESGVELRALATRYEATQEVKEERIRTWLEARRSGDEVRMDSAHRGMVAAQKESEALRAETKAVLIKGDPGIQAKDSDYVFITFILRYLPHGLIGLLVAVFFAATFSSKAGELNALGTTTAVDLYRHMRRGGTTDAQQVRAAKVFTAMWGLVAIAFALYANLVENLIEAVNILGSLFYGVVLGLFLVAFFLKRVGGTAVFAAAVIAQITVLILYTTLSISYLWYNLIGCAGCVGLSLVLQAVLPSRPASPHATPTS